MAESSSPLNRILPTEELGMAWHQGMGTTHHHQVRHKKVHTQAHVTIIIITFHHHSPTITQRTLPPPSLITALCSCLSLTTQVAGRHHHSPRYGIGMGRQAGRQGVAHHQQSPGNKQGNNTHQHHHQQHGKNSNAQQ